MVKDSKLLRDFNSFFPREGEFYQRYGTNWELVYKELTQDPTIRTLETIAKYAGRIPLVFKKAEEASIAIPLEKRLGHYTEGVPRIPLFFSDGKTAVITNPIELFVPGRTVGYIATVFPDLGMKGYDAKVAEVEAAAYRNGLEPRYFVDRHELKPRGNWPYLPFKLFTDLVTHPEHLVNMAGGDHNLHPNKGPDAQILPFVPKSKIKP
ncbi:hypothetical protein HYU09_05480 [Candidatus Woesearchaeota archaeon]|nr:hypothetical protein [Candidatus Woesearchaeota archaeon]